VSDLGKFKCSSQTHIKIG